MTEKTQGFITAGIVLVLSGAPMWFYTQQKIEAGWDKTREAQHKQQGWKEEEIAVQALAPRYPGQALTPLTPPPKLVPVGEPVRLDQGGAAELAAAAAPCMALWGPGGSGASLDWSPGMYRPVLVLAAKEVPPDPALACMLKEMWRRPVEIPAGTVVHGL